MSPLIVSLFSLLDHIEFKCFDQNYDADLRHVLAVFEKQGFAK